VTRYSDNQEGYLAKEEVLEWLRSRVEELELELKALKTIMAILDSGQQALVGERVEEVKIGRRSLHRRYICEGCI